MAKLKKLGKNLLAILIGTIFSLLLAEMVLRIYNPLPSRFRGDKIMLKTNVKKRIIIEPKVPGLDSIINYSVNGLGFRGEEKPNNFNDVYSIITVGGSTTECSMLDDSKTWTEKLGKKLKSKHPNIWINNAGLDGATTYGHNILLDDYILKLKPKMVIFLIGVNDRGRNDFNGEDGNLINRKESFIIKLIKKSELANLINNLYLMYRTNKVNIGHELTNNVKAHSNNVPNKPVILDSIQLEKILSPYRKNLISYKERVRQLAQKCIKNSIKPVFITQPLVYDGEGWEIMELYNKSVIAICNELQIDYIDLANEMKKDQHYFYDSMHYTNEGAEMVSDIIFAHLNEYLNKK